MNEFFRCPTYAYGAFLLAMIFALVVFIYLKAKSNDSNNIMDVIQSLGTISYLFAGLTFVWLVWTIWNWFFRHEDCTPIGFRDGSFANPLSGVM